MKRYKFSLLMVAAMAIAFSSCLDENPKDQIPADDIYSDASSIYINAVASLYNYIGGSADSEGLQGTGRGVYDYNTITSDEAIIPIRGGDWYDGGFWTNLYQHTWTKSDESLYDTWKYLYKVVMLSNSSLEIIEKNKALLTAAQHEEYTAEVRAVRALFYYYLMDMFGRVPLITSTTTPQSEVVQSQRSDVFHFIYDELCAVESVLPWEMSCREGDYYGRITKGVVVFLKAKLMLNAEVYADDDWTDGVRPSGKDLRFKVQDRELNAWEACIAYCDMLEQLDYSLEEYYATNFAVHNETSKENIFTIPMDKSFYSNKFIYLFRSRHYSHGAALGCASENGTCATISTMKNSGYGTDDVDSRFHVNFYAGEVQVDGKTVTLDNGEPLVYEPMKVELNLTASRYKNTAGARMAKYEVDRMAHADGCLPDNDIVLFRYADALLMRAEAKVRNGESGYDDMNAVRARVYMSPREATLDNILSERLLELVWEGWRRQDLIRYGLFYKSYDLRTALPGEQNGYTTVFPIPAKCISLNPKLKQNPGY